MALRLVAVAQAAGFAIREIYHSVEAGVVITKEDNSPLTKADLAANKVICEALSQHYPDIPIISEENQQIEFSQRKNYPRFFLVDPLDGTKEFIKRNGEFTVNIALIEGDRPVLGVVYAPELDQMYVGEQGQGSWRWDQKWTQIQARDQLVQPADLIASASHMTSLTKSFIQRWPQVQLTQAGSSLKFIKVAIGECDCYPRMVPCMEWDTAAADIIVQEAGGLIDRYNDQGQFSGEHLKYNKENLLSPFFVVWANTQVKNYYAGLV